MAQRPNPQTIGICVLIALHSDPNSLLHELDGDDEGSPIAVSENVIAAFLEESVFGNITNGSGNDDSLAVWVARTKRRLGTQAAELLLDTLRMASESVDSLMDLFESLKGAILEGLVDATSLHGLYIRQYCLGFDELSFESYFIMASSQGTRVVDTAIEIRPKEGGRYTC